jgi:enoyl-CoA hydratase/carnithine racemase
MSASEPVACEILNGTVAVLTIQRPERLNALNLAVKQMVEQHLLDLGQRPDIACVVVTGNREVFVAGTDLAEMCDMSSADHGRLRTGAMFEVLRAFPAPLIAAVEGYALGGGCELALACDMIVAGDKARFGQPEIKVGIMPGAGGTQILSRTLGSYRAMKMVLTGEMLSAADALALGLVSEVVEAGTALESAIELASTIAKMPPLSVRAIKAVIKRGQDLPLSDAIACERRAFEALFDTEDQNEGMTAFLEKRRPVFRGR